MPRAPSPALLARRSDDRPRPTAAGAGRRDADAPTTRRADAIVYRVRKGDTLSSIARRHGVSVENLRSVEPPARLGASAIGDRLTSTRRARANAQ